MFTGLILMCSMTDPTMCKGFAGQGLPTLEQCEASLQQGIEQLTTTVPNGIIVGATCYNWGSKT